jgi:pimeloyl-ACP methyl ester carboxylesterase
MMFRTSDSKAVAAFAKDGVTLHTNTLKVNERKLHYVYTGADSLPTIVFVHGSPGSWNAFEQYLKDADLLKKFRMFSIDRPGFGYSNFGDALNLEEQSLIISPLFQQIKNGKPVYLVGHSLGGPMIVQLYLDNPGMFSSLVILAGSIDPNEEKPERWRKIFINNPFQYLVPGAMRPSNEELWYLKNDLKILAPRMKAVDAAVHIIHGTKDQFVPYGNLAFGVKIFTNAKSMDTVSIPDANHFIPWQHYDVIKKVLMGL